jgi:hypothetical protein
MRTGFLLTGLIILLLANIVMMYGVYSFKGPSYEGFTSYYLENAGGAKNSYEAIGPFDGVKLTPDTGVDTWRYTSPNEPLMGPEFKPGQDSLFIFKNNQSKPSCCSASYSSDLGCVCTTPQQRRYINMRGGNRTVEDGI